ncbi:MAG: DUF599 domain-containing protein [Pseudomonadota bacterium]
MTLLTSMTLLTLFDAIALVFLVLALVGSGWVIEHPPASRPSVTKIMSANRRKWMKVFITRDPRIFDAQIVTTLRQGTSFFASTCILAIGGVLALISNTEPLSGVAEDVAMLDVPVVIWQVKLAVVALLLTNAFLKFVWSNRVFGYCAVMMSAVPNDPTDPETDRMASQAAELNIRAAVNFNRGLRSIYFALGSLVWLLGAVPLIVATCIVLWTVMSREFASIPRDILLGKDL